MKSLITNQTRLIAITAQTAYRTLKPFIKHGLIISGIILAAIVLVILTISVLLNQLNSEETPEPIETEETPETVETVIESLEILAETFPTIFNPPTISTMISATTEDLQDLDLEELKTIAKAHKVKGWNVYKKPESLIAKLLTVL